MEDAAMTSYPKRTEYRNPKLLKAAKGQECTVQVPGVCIGGTETTVAAHSPFGEDGKGMGQKADDCFIAFACSACHDWLDGRGKKITSDYDRDAYFNRGVKRTLRNLLERGILK